MNKKRGVLLLLFSALIAAFFFFDLGRFFDLAYVKQQQAAFAGYYAQYRLLTIGTYFLFYVAVTALSLPGATVLTVAGGALFGFWLALVLVSFASSIGALLAMLTSRVILREFVERRFADKLSLVNQGLAKDGALYLFALRLVPLFPFFVVNLVMGLTKIKVSTFYWTSQLGMLAATALFVNVGTQLAQVEQLSDVISPKIFVSFVVLGLFPFFARYLQQQIAEVFRLRKLYAPWKSHKPLHYDYNLVVIGAGSAGLVSAYIGATTQAKVALVEKDQMGGDCLNTGCVPSKALLRSARFLSDLRRCQEFGIKDVKVSYDFAQVMERVQRVIKKVAPHDSIERYTKLGVKCFQGHAKITSPWTVEVTTKDQVISLKTKNIVIASGAKPAVPTIPGLQTVPYFTSDTVWSLKALPSRLLVLGGGPIGCELTQAFARLGSQVTLLEMAPRLLSREDNDVSVFIQQQLESEGVRVLTKHKAKEFFSTESENFLIIEPTDSPQHEQKIQFDVVLVAVGREPSTAGFGLKGLGVEMSANKTIQCNDYLQTTYPNIYVCGDVAGPFQFTHTASHQAWYATVNALYGKLRRFKADYQVIPWAIFTAPEVARVGINEDEAKKKNIRYEVSSYDLSDLDRAIADEEACGFIKVITKKGSDKILGVTIVGNHAAEIVSEFVVAMKYKLGLSKVLKTIHIYPTMAEANKYVAGNWRKAKFTVSQRQLLSIFNGCARANLGLSKLLSVALKVK